MTAPDSRIAVVSGANRGIGFEICRQLAGLGIHVILTSRDEAPGEKARNRLGAAALELDYHQLDVTSPESIGRLSDYVRDEYGSPDILVNNAAVYLDDRSSLLRMKMGTCDITLDTNLRGPLLLCQSLVPLMKKHNYGRVVNVSSGAGQMAEMGSGWPAYRISKAGLNALTLILADELRGSNVLVNAVCPGWVRTDMGGPHADRSIEEGADTAVWLATLPDGGPTGGFFRDREPIPW
jgi:NAD(P)-dependent dehydrogenase (short-subunit alcohol dehydrogenase family)